MMKKYLALALALLAPLQSVARNTPTDTVQYSTQASAPSAPVAGTVMSYHLTSDGAPYWKNSAGSAFGLLYSSSTLTNHGVMLGAGTRAPTVMSVCSDNTVFVGNTGADPSCRTLLNADFNASAALDLSKLATQAAATFVGRASGAGTGVPTVLTGTQAAVIIDAFVGDSGSGGTKGQVPAPASGDTAAGKFLKADGTWAVPSGGGGSSAASDYGIYLSHPTGNGSTNTKIRTYGRVVKNTASGYVTLTQSATNGDSFTAAQDGLFAVCAGDARATSDMSLAITVNDSIMTTSGRSGITWAQGKRALYAGVSANDFANVCDVMNLSTNDVVRVHSDGNNSATDQTGYFYIYYLGAKSASSLFLDGGNGYGSSNTLIRRWVSPAAENTGTAFTVTDSSTLGMTITINEDGMYWVCRAESNSSSFTSLLGIVSVNDATLTNTTPYSYTYAQGRRLTHSNDINYYTANNIVCGFFKFSNGDILRGHDYSSGTANGTNSYVYFRAIKISATSKVVYADAVSGAGSVATRLRYFGTLQYWDPAYISISNSTLSGTAVIALAPAVYGACTNEYSSTTSNSGVVVRPKAPTSNMSTPLSYGDGFRGYRKFGGGSSTQGHCAFDFLNTGDQMYEQNDANTGTDSFIGISAGRLN